MTDSTLDSGYSGWMKPAAVAGGLAAVAGLAWKLYSSDVDESRINAAHQEPRKQELALKEAPRPQADVKKMVERGYVHEPGVPTTEGFEHRMDAVYPDFEPNEDYGNFGNINNFMLALIELRRNEEAEKFKEEIMLPGAEPTWGIPERGLEAYRIKGMRQAPESEIPEELLGKGLEKPDFYEVSLGVRTEYTRMNDGEESGTQRYLIVAKKDGRFYLVK